MRFRVNWLLLIGLLSCYLAAGQQRKVNRTQPLINYVQPFWGTEGDHGQLSPAASLPFSLAKPGPQSVPGSHSGYNHADSAISGFTMVRYSGSGCKGAGGNLMVSPVLTSYQKEPSADIASPVYYSMTYNQGPKVEITGGYNTAWLRFSYREKRVQKFTINLSQSLDEIVKYESNLTADNYLIGSITARNVCAKGAYTIYFALHCAQGWQQDSVSNIAIKQNGLISFQTREAEQLVDIKVGLSSLSALAAKQNLEIGLPPFLSFIQMQEKGESVWEKHLGAVQIMKGGTPVQKQMFYTALYNSLQFPMRQMEVPNVYMGHDGLLHDKELGTDFYAGHSIWDTYRTQLPLVAMLYPEEARDICTSLLALLKSKRVNWSSDNESMPNVRTDQALIALLDFYRKQLNTGTYTELLALALPDTVNMEYTTPDKKLEAYQNWWALSIMAHYARQPAIAKTLEEKAFKWRSVWQESLSDTTNDDADVMHARRLYEGTPWQYRWAPVWDLQYLQTLHGSKEGIKNALVSYKNQNLHNVGNQPGIHVPWLATVFGLPWQTQAWVAQLLDSNASHAYGTHKKFPKPFLGPTMRPQAAMFVPEMDDDGGTMSAWYVWATLGLYPICPGEPIYALSAPRFNKMRLKLENDRYFNITCNYTKGDTGQYIQKATLNNRPLTTPMLTHKQIVGGGSLTVWLGSRPNPAWGLQPGPLLTSIGSARVQIVSSNKKQRKGR